MDRPQIWGPALPPVPGARLASSLPGDVSHVTVDIITSLCPHASDWLRSGSLSLAVLTSAPELAHFSLFLGLIGTNAPATSKEWTIPLETATFRLWATGELPTQQGYCLLFTWKLLTEESASEQNVPWMTPTLYTEPGTGSGDVCLSPQT